MTVIMYYRDVSWWLYLLIGVSIVVTFLLTNKVLDKIATPVSKNEHLVTVNHTNHSLALLIAFAQV